MLDFFLTKKRSGFLIIWTVIAMLISGLGFAYGKTRALLSGFHPDHMFLSVPKSVSVRICPAAPKIWQRLTLPHLKMQYHQR